jgi:endoglucanase
MNKLKFFSLLLSGILCSTNAYSQSFRLQDNGYFQNQGIDIMAFDDIYPEGHQGGVSLIMNGKRLATNGDVRLEATPGQWQPVSKMIGRKADTTSNTISVCLCFPDSSRHLHGSNPMIYPDLQLTYHVTVKGDSNGVKITVDLDTPIPDKYKGKVGFNLELFPGELFGEPWVMDNQTGIFPRQANGPVQNVTSNMQYTGHYNALPDGDANKADISQLKGNGGFNPIIADDVIGTPYAKGYTFTVCPNDALRKYTIVSKQQLKLYDGRVNHNNGWFVLRSEIPVGATKKAIEWTLTPEVTANWKEEPAIQISQVGYHPDQPKTAVIELDNRDTARLKATLYRIDKDGKKAICNLEEKEWGRFLRYNYLKCDFSQTKEEGLYQLGYGNVMSSIFRIAKDIYDRGVWQPVLEYFLPIQMCHSRVSEKYRVWHDYCHSDDARMAAPGNHFDGYVQDAKMLIKYKAGERVPGLNVGGWHDAGDFDLRVESQAGEAYILALAQECFHPDYDATTIDQNRHITEIHQPDGKQDMLQQIENGALTVVAGYKALGRLYRGIICHNLRQYVMLGDAADMTDRTSGNSDDRWVFTEDNPQRELSTAAQLSAISRVLKGYNDTLSTQCLNIAQTLYETTRSDNTALSDKIQAATELWLTTRDIKYKSYLLTQQDYIVQHAAQVGWCIGRAAETIGNKKFAAALRKALLASRDILEKMGEKTPYGVPYRPYIWGAGWDIQSFGFRHYFLMKSYPDIFDSKYLFDALNFVLGCHPGSNTESFASGVGTVSATTAYGFNRADWSYIPGGVISGTALIRPDFPELLKFPFLWQQTEYVLGGGSSHYMFLVLAAQQILNAKEKR